MCALFYFSQWMTFMKITRNQQTTTICNKPFFFNRGGRGGGRIFASLGQILSENFGNSLHCKLEKNCWKFDKKSQLTYVDGNSVIFPPKGIYLVSDSGNKAERKCFWSSIPETEFVSLKEVTLNWNVSFFMYISDWLDKICITEKIK